MATIAFMGNVGCGKTVLLTVLTHVFQREDEAGRQITPNNTAAIAFSTEKWRFFVENEWPRPTPPEDDPPTYIWTLKNKKYEKTIATSDIAGGAWREFIIENLEAETRNKKVALFDKFIEKCRDAVEELSSKGIENHLTKVKNFLNDSPCIVWLVDLGEIIDQREGNEKEYFLPLAMLNYLKKKKRSNIPVILVLTKTDNYSFVLEKYKTWENVVAEYLPFAAHHDSKGNFKLDFYKIIPVAAVADTKDGKPAENFSSDGLAVLLDEILKAINQGENTTFWNSILHWLKWDLLILFLCWVILQLFVFMGDELVRIDGICWTLLILYVIIKFIKMAITKR